MPGTGQNGGSAFGGGNGYIRSVEMPELRPRVLPKRETEVRGLEVDAGREVEQDVSENESTDDILIMGTNGRVWDGRAHEGV